MRLKTMALLACALAAAGATVEAGEQRDAAGEAATRNVAILLYEGVEILDFAGPAEVFEAAGHQAQAASGGAAPFRLYTVARTKDPVLSQRFLRITPDYSIADAPSPAILVIPGGNSGRLQEDPGMMAWITRVAARSEMTLTVCTGVFPLVKAGLLDGKEITTWYGALDRLREVAVRSTVQPGRRFVDNGQFVTTAGVSAGIDGALHAVARLLGRHVAERTAQYMEYRWTPEAYLASAYPYFNPSAGERGRALQRGALAEQAGDLAAAASEYRAAAESGDADAWIRLGRLAHKRKDYAAAEKAFARAADSAPQKALAAYNAACATALQGRKDDAVRWLETAVAAGLEPAHILHDSDLESVRDEPRVRALLAARAAAPLGDSGPGDQTRSRRP